MRVRDVVRGLVATGLLLAAVVGGVRGATRGAPSGTTPGVRIEIDAPSPDTRVRVTLRRDGAAAGAAASGPEISIDVGTEGAVVPLPEGAPFRAWATCERPAARDGAGRGDGSRDGDGQDPIVWPRSAAVRDGGVVRFHVEPLRIVRLASAGTVAAAGRSGGLRFVPDRFVVPAGPPERIDALQVWSDTTCPAAVPAEDGAHVRLPQGTAWWCLGRAAGAPVAGRIGPDDVRHEVIAAPLRRLADEPRVSGAALPAGTLVAPGRLDAYAVAFVRRLVARREFPGAVVRGTGAWREVALPASDVLTLAHRSFGIAHAGWTDAGVAPAHPEPGEISFVAGAGGSFSASVAVWPCWPGSGGVFSRPFDSGLRVGASGVASLVVRGLPLGTYRFDCFASRGAAPPGADLHRGSLRLDAAIPRAVVDVSDVIE